jgi:hypothetical protein
VSGSFLKKKPKNFCYCTGRAAQLSSPARGISGKSFCFFFQKEALASFA